MLVLQDWRGTLTRELDESATQLEALRSRGGNGDAMPHHDDGWLATWFGREPGCGWVRQERWGLLPKLPPLPKLPQFKFTSPRMPERLLPWGVQKWNELQEGVPQEGAPQAIEPSQPQAQAAASELWAQGTAAAAGLAGGALVAALISLGRNSFGRRRLVLMRRKLSRAWSARTHRASSEAL